MSTEDAVNDIRIQLEKDRERLAGFTGMFQISVIGDQPGDFYVGIDDGIPVVALGSAANPDCIIEVTGADFQRMAMKQATPMGLFLSGRARVSGNRKLAFEFYARVGKAVFGQ